MTRLELGKGTHTMAALNVSGNTAHNQPWAHTDVEGLIQKLQILREGVGLLGMQWSSASVTRLPVGYAPGQDS